MTLTAVQDALDEVDETIIVDISSVINATELGTQQVTALIADDDPEPTVSFSTASFSGRENDTSVSLAVSISPAGLSQDGDGWLRPDEELPPLRETAALDELELKRELSDICHRTGVPDWQSLVKKILDWIAEASGAERSRRIEALNRLIEEIKVQASRLERLRSPQEQKQADEARQQIHQLLKSFVDAFSVKGEMRRSD